MPRGPRVSTVLRSMSLSDLQRAIADRRRADEAMLARLVRRRRTLQGEMDSLSGEIADIEERLRALGGVVRRGPGRPKGSGKSKAGARRGPGRPKGSVNKKRGGRARPGQKELAIDVLKEAKKPMHQADIAKALLKKGVRSASKAFDRSLGLMLSQDKRFKKVKRAVYTLR